MYDQELDRIIADAVARGAERSDITNAMWRASPAMCGLLYKNTDDIGTKKTLVGYPFYRDGKFEGTTMALMVGNLIVSFVTVPDVAVDMASGPDVTVHADVIVDDDGMRTLHNIRTEE